MGSDTVILLSSAFVYFQVSFLLSHYYFGQHVPQPYMDEIFHVPQAQQYCKGNYNEVQKILFLIWRTVIII